MQPTSKQTVPSTPVPTKPAEQSQGTPAPLPLPLEGDALRQIGGGLGLPRGNW